MENKWKIQLSVNGVNNGFCKILTNGKIGIRCEEPICLIENYIMGKADEESTKRSIATYFYGCLNEKTVARKILEETINVDFSRIDLSEITQGFVDAFLIWVYDDTECVREKLKIRTYLKKRKIQESRQLQLMKI